jgi:hypothetical protein
MSAISATSCAIATLTAFREGVAHVQRGGKVVFAIGE